MPFLLEADTPAVPEEYDLPLSYVELKDEVAQANAAVALLAWSIERTTDQHRLALLTDQLCGAYEHLDACHRALDAMFGPED